jgi:O-succinylbenzoate synthase
LGPEGRIRIDVNAAWDLETATERLESLARFDLEYAEQPVRTLEEMVELRRRTRVPLAADELVRLRPDPLEVAEMGAADVLVVKVQPLGGVARTLDIAARAGIPVVVSSALETSIGIYSGLLVASLLGSLPYACGLGTVSLIEGDPTRKPLVSMDGELEVRRPEPDPMLLARWRPDRDRAAEMLRKVRSAAQVLT